MKKRSRMTWVKILLVLLITGTVYWLALSRFISTEQIKKQDYSFHYTILSASSVLAGFQFTGISILMSVTEKPRVSRLWNYGYLDILCRVSVAGIFFNVLTIIITLCIIVVAISAELLPKIIHAEIFVLIFAIVLFCWSILELAYVIGKSKDPEQH